MTMNISQRYEDVLKYFISFLMATVFVLSVVYIFSSSLFNMDSEYITYLFYLIAMAYIDLKIINLYT